MKKRRTIMIVAGEASGDRHGAKLVKALRDEDPDCEFTFFGAAGERMCDAGVDPVIDSNGLSIVGLAEILAAIPMFIRTFSTLVHEAKIRKPDSVILVDFPEFNLKLARSLKKQGFPVVYYISPQIWAWRKYRISTIRKYVDLLITILPFEQEWYRVNGFEKIEYVGNPLVREVHVNRSKIEFCRDFQLDPNEMIVSLLPGSRNKEIVRILPVMLETAINILRTKPKVQFLISIASERNNEDVGQTMAALNINESIHSNAFRVIVDSTYDAVNASDAAAVTSGTATLETGIIGTPMAVVYKTSSLNYSLFRPLIKASHFSLVNLLAGERISAELIQGDFTAETLSSELLRLLDPRVNADMRSKLIEAAAKLGPGGASKRAAKAILRMLG